MTRCIKTWTILTDRQTDRQTGYNYGFALLKILMCFEVVRVHFGKGTEEGIIIGRLWSFISTYAGCAVPCFEIMAFCFSYKMLTSRDDSKLKDRLKHLVLPIIAWAFIYIAIFWMLNDNSYLQGLSWKVAFILQIFVGHVYNPPMWFQTDLIVATVIFYVLYRCFYKNKKLLCIIIGLMGAVAFASQYTGINYALFGGLPNYLGYTPGRFAEMIPYTIAGLLLGRKAKKEHSLKGCIFWIAFIILARKILAAERGLGLLGDSFGYAGVGLMLLGLGIVKLFDELNFIKFPEVIEKVIREVSKLTYGCYIMHRLVGYFVTKINWEFLSKSPLKKCLTIYIIGLLCTYTISHIVPDKYNFLTK